MRALGVAPARHGVGGGVRGEHLRQAAAALEHGADRPGRVEVGAVAVGVDLRPDPAHDVDAEAVAEVLPPDPVAVVGAGVGEGVEREVGEPDLPVGEVLTVVVDRVGEALLHPHRRRLEQPRVVGEVVGELDRVEELVGQGDLEVLHRAAAELRAGEVVVDHAVARGDLAAAGLVVLRHAVAVEAGAEVLEVDVELRVAAVPAVGDRRPVAQGVDLVAVDAAEHRQRALGPGLAGRAVGGGAHVVQADPRPAPPHRRGAVAAALRVGGPVAGPGQDQLGQPPVLALEVGQGGEEVPQHRGGLLALHRRRPQARPGLEDPHGAGQGGLGQLTGAAARHGHQGSAVASRRAGGGGRDAQDAGDGRGQGDGGGQGTAAHGAPHPVGEVVDDCLTTGVVGRGRRSSRAVDAAGQPVPEIFSIRAVVEMAGVRAR